MRIVFVSIMIIFSLATKAQFSPFTSAGYMQRPLFARNIYLNDSADKKKIFLTHYAGLSTSFIFFKGGNATIVSAPVGLQLNRKLNNNFYAFAGVAAAPAYINFNNTFLNTNANKLNQKGGFSNTNNFGLYTRAEVELMYVNDAKTFSISGSIGVENNSFPVYPYNQNNTAKPYPVNSLSQ